MNEITLGEGIKALTSSRGEETLMQAFFHARKETTIKAYGECLQTFVAFLKKKGLPSFSAFFKLDIAGAHLIGLAYKDAMMKEKLAPSTVNLRLSALKSFCRLARRMGKIAWTLDIEGQKVKKYKDTRGPDNEGMKALLAQAIAQDPSRSARDQALIWLMFGRGLRRGEVAALDVCDYETGRQVDRHTIAIVGKGENEKIKVTLPGPAVAALDAWLKVRGPDFDESGDEKTIVNDGPLFIPLNGHARTRLTGKGIWHIIQGLGHKAGLKVWPHALRHSGITRAIAAAGGNFEAAQAFSRHADPRTIMLYNDNQADLGGELSQKVSDL